VDSKSGGIDRFVTLNDITLFIDEHEIRDLDEREVHRKRV
jgi:hypothetical protein